MPELPNRITLLVEIEQRQDDLLRQLDELEKKIAGVLAEYTASCQPKQGGVAAMPMPVGQIPAQPAAPRAA